jgi:hypothetical protein
LPQKSCECGQLQPEGNGYLKYVGPKNASRDLLEIPLKGLKGLMAQREINSDPAGKSLYADSLQN